MDIPRVCSTVALMEAVVYWIHLPNHTDVYTEGYVGVTVQFNERMRAHKNRPGGIMARVVAKYEWENLVVDVIHRTTEEESYKLESHYRPDRMIGWNIAEGGIRPPTECPIKKSKRMRENNPSSTPKGREQRRQQFLKNNPVHTKESYENMKAGVKASRAIKYPCVHCGKRMDSANLNKWHNDNCKHKEG